MRDESGRDGAMTNHAVVIAGGGPTGLMLAAELALAGVDVAIVERRETQDLPSARAGGLHARTIEVFDQRGVAERFLSQGTIAQVAGYSFIRLDISDFPTRHNYGLALWQKHIERILAGWIEELPVTFYRGREVTGFAQDATGVDVQVSDGEHLRAQYLVGCDGGRSLIRKVAGIEFPGWDASTSALLADCAAVSCEDECSALGFLPPPLGACERCVYGECGSEMDACVGVADCPTLLVCIAACGVDVVCQGSCAALYPGAVVAAQTVGNCSLAYCSEDCL